MTRYAKAKIKISVYNRLTKKPIILKVGMRLTELFMNLFGLVASELIAFITSFYSVNWTNSEISLNKELTIISERNNI